MANNLHDLFDGCEVPLHNLLADKYPWRDERDCSPACRHRQWAELHKLWIFQGANRG